MTTTDEHVLDSGKVIDLKEFRAALKVNLRTKKDRARFAYRILDHIENNPDQWNQRYYRCNTGMCYAGWAVVLSNGAEWATDNVTRTSWTEDGIEIKDDTVLVGPYRMPAHDFAVLALGLDEEHGYRMFSPENTIEDLRAAILKIFGPRP